MALRSLFERQKLYIKSNADAFVIIFHHEISSKYVCAGTRKQFLELGCKETFGLPAGWAEQKQLVYKRICSGDLLDFSVEENGLILNAILADAKAGKRSSLQVNPCEFLSGDLSNFESAFKPEGLLTIITMVNDFINEFGDHCPDSGAERAPDVGGEDMGPPGSGAGGGMFMDPRSLAPPARPESPPPPEA